MSQTLPIGATRHDVAEFQSWLDHVFEVDGPFEVRIRSKGGHVVDYQGIAVEVKFDGPGVDETEGLGLIEIECTIRFVLTGQPGMSQATKEPDHA